MLQETTNTLTQSIQEVVTQVTQTATQRIATTTTTLIQQIIQTMSLQGSWTSSQSLTFGGGATWGIAGNGIVPGFVPGTIIPDTVIPGTVIPGTVIPGTIIPGTTIPGTIIPGTIIPGSIPGSILPPPRIGPQPIVNPPDVSAPNIPPSPSTPVPPRVSPPDLATAQWIWTKEAAAGNPPGGPRPFRKVIEFGEIVDRLTIDIDCDNFYTLYVNGCVVGKGIDWRFAQRYNVVFAPTRAVVIAVYAVQDPISLAQAGLIAAGVLWNSQIFESTSYTVGTDDSWKCLSNNKIPKDFMSMRFSDRNWEKAYVEGPFGMQPWNPVAKPTTASPGTDVLTGMPGGVPDAPPAPRAEVKS